MRGTKAKACIPFLILSLMTSCGIDMRDWPYVELGFSSPGVHGLFIDYLSRIEPSKSARYSSTERNVLDEFDIQLTNLHHGPDATTSMKHLRNYNQRIRFYFFLEEDVRDFKAYVCGMETYFLYDDEIRWFPADFHSAFLNAIESVADDLTRIDS